MAKKPRIFISYRRSDSITVTGRIYDRLCTAFSEEGVFKDMEDIPMGVDFREVIEKEIAACDVLLAIIGRNWLDVADEKGSRRLDDHNDFVRIEIETALKRADSVLVIPVLVDNALMPTTEHLPESLHPLPYRNGAVIRNDPDFNHDVEALFSQINKHFHLTGQPKRRLPIQLIAVSLAVIALVVAAALFISHRPATSTNVAQAGIPTVEPPAPGTYRVLVAQIEPLRNPTQRPVARLIADNLNQMLYKNVPYSVIQVTEYAELVTSDDQALQVADENNAAIIIWGNYTDQAVTLNVQIGSLKSFPNIRPSDRALLERTVNVQVRLTDELTQSLATPVLSNLFALNALEGNGYETIRSALIKVGLTQNQEGEIIGDTIAAHDHRSFQEANPTGDLSSAIDNLTQSIGSDPSNPMLFLLRSFYYLWDGRLDASRADVESTSRLKAGWAMSDYMRTLLKGTQGDWHGAAAEMDTVIQSRTDEWYPLYQRGYSNYWAGDYAAARTDLDKALTLHPTEGWPYFLESALALRDGRITDAQQFLQVIQQNFPDMRTSLRILSVAYGKSAPSLVVETFTAFSDIYLQRYDDVINDTDAALQAGVTAADIDLFRGYAFCENGDLQQAETSYTTGLDIEPNNVGLYLLRASVRNANKNLAGALQDIQSASKLAQDPDFETYVQAGLKSQSACPDLFNGIPVTAGQTPTPVSGTS